RPRPPVRRPPTARRRAARGPPPRSSCACTRSPSVVPAGALPARRTQAPYARVVCEGPAAAHPSPTAAGSLPWQPGRRDLCHTTTRASRPETGHGCGPKPVPGIPAVVARGTTAPYHYLIYHVYMVATVSSVGDSPPVAREGEMT